VFGVERGAKLNQVTYDVSVTEPISIFGYSSHDTQDQAIYVFGLEKKLMY
jgi:hypothetical protein